VILNEGLDQQSYDLILDNKSIQASISRQAIQTIILNNTL
jgi:hypothetical protein